MTKLGSTLRSQSEIMNRKDFQKREENEQILGIPEAANSEEDDNSERHHDTDRTDQTG